VNSQKPRTPLGPATMDGIVILGGSWRGVERIRGSASPHSTPPHRPPPKFASSVEVRAPIVMAHVCDRGFARPERLRDPIGGCCAPPRSGFAGLGLRETLPILATRGESPSLMLGTFCFWLSSRMVRCSVPSEFRVVPAVVGEISS
jgi:hypothetical protein